MYFKYCVEFKLNIIIHIKKKKSIITVLLLLYVMISNLLSTEISLF